MQVTKVGSTRLPAAKPRLVQARRPARQLAVRAMAEAKLKRSISSVRQCTIGNADGLEVYCNVVKKVEREDGTEAFQFVVVFPTENSALETVDYEFYKSAWYPTQEECQAAIESFDLKTVLPV